MILKAAKSAYRPGRPCQIELYSNRRVCPCLCLCLGPGHVPTVLHAILFRHAFPNVCPFPISSSSFLRHRKERAGIRVVPGGNPVAGLIEQMALSLERDRPTFHYSLRIDTNGLDRVGTSNRGRKECPHQRSGQSRHMSWV